MKKLYSTLLLVMAMLCTGANNAWAEDVSIQQVEWQNALAAINSACGENGFTLTFASSYTGSATGIPASPGINIYRDGETNNYIVAPTTAGDVIKPECAGLFTDCTNLTAIDFTNFDTSSAENMSGMFSCCTSLTSLDLSSFDTSNVEYMNGMFRCCTSLTSLDLSGFNTSKVTDMECMFDMDDNDESTSSLVSITFGENFVTSNVTSMANMFNDCSSLTSLDLSNFNTSNVTDMKRMFDGCSSLQSLTLSNNFSTSNVETMYAMFGSCSSLTSLDLSNFNTSKVTIMESMFDGCGNLESLTLSSNFNTSNVTTMSGMFNGCEKLASLDLSSFNTSSVTDMGWMFCLCSNLTELDLSCFDTSSVTTMSCMFASCSKLTTIIVGNGWSTKGVDSESSGYMFNDCTKLKGQNGTTYNSDYIDATYARVDENGQPGYFSTTASGGGSGEGGGETPTTPALSVGPNNLTLPASTGSEFIATFTPSDPGAYTFVISPAMPLVIVDSSNQAVGQDMSSGKVTTSSLVANQTYNIYILNQTATTGSITITEGSGSGGETTTSHVLSVGTNTVHLYAYDSEDAEDEDYLYTFTPTKDDHYVFTFSNNGSPIEVYAGIGENANATDSKYTTYLITPKLTAGTTYDFYVDGNFDEYESATITITEGVYYTPLTEGTNTAHIYAYDETGYEYYLYSFTPTENGQYKFTFSKDGSPIAVFVGLDEDADSDGSSICSTLTTATLTAGTTYTIYVDGNNDKYESATVNISKVEGESEGMTYEREMAYEWGTLCLPASITYNANNGNYKLYKLTAAGEDALTFTEVADGTTTEASIPMAVKAVGKKNDAGKFVISIACPKTKYVSGKSIKLENGYSITGINYSITGQTGVYFIAENKFWYADDAITVPSYRAFITAPASSDPQAKVLNIIVEDEADGIKAVNSEQLTVNNGKFIENGKVVVIKNGKKFNVNGQRVR